MSSMEFSKTETVGRMTGIEAGDAGNLCLKSQVLDTDGKLTYIMTNIMDIKLGMSLILLELYLLLKVY